jgi:lipopolysaccharide transport system permease protein
VVKALKEVHVLFQYRELLWMWTIRNVKVRYKQSFLGAAWAVLQPLSLMILFSIVFSYFLRIPTDGIPYPIFSYTALLPWVFFASSVTLGVSSLVSNMNLVTKIYFPREILPVAVIMAGFFDLMIAALVFGIMLIYYEISITVTILMVPILLTVQVMLTIGVVLFASAANIFYRDIQFVVPLGVQLWMYATPIIYPLSTVPEQFRSIYMLNPMAGLIESYRAVILKGTWPEWQYLGISAIVSVTIFIFGYVFFKRVEWQFADII